VRRGRKRKHKDDGGVLVLENKEGSDEIIQMQRAMAFFADNQKRIMTTFMFWVYLISDKIKRFVDGTDFSPLSPLEYDELLLVPQTIWPRLSRFMRTTFLTSNENTCVFDMFDCPQATRAEDCKRPCHWDEVLKKCRNAGLFGAADPPLDLFRDEDSD